MPACLPASRRRAILEKVASTRYAREVMALAAKRGEGPSMQRALAHFGESHTRDLDSRYLEPLRRQPPFADHHPDAPYALLESAHTPRATEPSHYAHGAPPVPAYSEGPDARQSWAAARAKDVHEDRKRAAEFFASREDMKSSPAKRLAIVERAGLTAPRHIAQHVKNETAVRLAGIDRSGNWVKFRQQSRS